MKRYLLLAALGVASIPLQFDIDDVVKKLTSHSLKYPQEKIFIHFDKPNYSTGETVWFKTYLVDAFSNEPITLSKVIYVELFNSKMELVDQKMLRVDNGGAAGDILLPESLTPGKYHIRAYTNWMRNFDQAFYYRHSFRILKTQTEEEYIKPEVQPMLSFFPEGGDLVNNVSSIVAIKATDQFGKGIGVKGKMMDESGNSITTLETDGKGMGALIFTPKSDQKVKASITFNEETYDFDLPEVKKNGYALRVINNFQSEKITITVTSENKPLANSGLIAHHSGEVFYSVINQSSNDAFAVRLDRKDFPAGICHITFFDPNGIPQAERLVYANYPKTRDIELSKNAVYDKRSLVSLSLNVKDTLIGDVPSNLSISITPRDLVKYTDDGENIINYLQLTSDLVGEIEQPAQYMRVDKHSFRSLDLLLLTQGWRRFKWEDVLNYDEADKPKHWSEDGIIFSGQVVDYYNRELPRESQISLSILDNDLGFVQGETDDQGSFFFTGNDFYDSTDLLFQAQRKLKRKEKLRNDVYISLDEKSQPDFDESYFNNYPIFKLKKQETYLAEKEKMEKIERAFNFDKDAIMLDAVQVTGVKEIRNDPFMSPFKVYGEPTNRVVADSIMRGVALISIYDLFRRIPGVRVFGSFPNQSIQIGGPGSINSSTDPLYLLDGINISVEAVNSITPSSISHIDVLNRADAAIYGSQGANGVVAIYTKSGFGLADTGPKDMGILNHSHPGYSKVREFFSPNYAKPIDEHAKPDFRTTLYWNPTIITGGGKAAPVSFYSSDQTGTFDIIVQGITVDGAPVFLKDSLVVE
ncbi:TonB-dependent receptor plug domain-containing protein [Ekhidna sp.]|uniref:TonB-dependent receptor plug domain-containing protein n=1 Tax=Ekhidna sp. TaxID=2608089 RepID=UPI003299065B